jgi:hypothetical protein
VSLVEHDHVVQALSTDRPDDAFDVGILPRRARCSAEGRHAERIDGAAERRIEGRVPIVEEESRGGVFPEGLAELLACPRGGGTAGHVEMQDPTSIVGKYYKHEQDPAGQRGHCEEVDRDGRADMVSEEGRQLWEDGFCRRGINRETVRSETSNPSFNNSPWIRGAPQSGFATAISRTSRRISAPACGRPPRDRDRRVQYHAKPRRCHATTVGGRTTTKADFQSRHAARSPIQNSRSGQRMVGFGRVRR